ncbi:S-adenosyl methyltransferase [Thermomonospora echinospora]|uniref:S-adenosyl methyltransferase n=1 Tax=Thermomonospora echinospora TaxID=1992 RepID=A0A1H5XWV0_9ACTN|nr:SAM-dependent methyltransferase [Thermomonospora echinospora]SEG15927.1 S-adenosyl methyltransferase [Thermomonospora echinospora]
MTGEQAPSGVDVTTPNVARIYDYFLGGKDNYAADRAAAEQIMQTVPEAPLAARANRAFLTRAVRFLAAEAGIRQFVDIGAGLPTQGNVHEVARRAIPDARVAYVDNDPVVLAHGRALLAGDDLVTVVQGDLRRPEEILGEPALRELIDLDRPVAVLLVAVLHFIADAEDPYAMVERLLDGLPSGSHLVISHGYQGGMDQDASTRAEGVYRRSTSAIHSRDPGQVRRFFGDWTVLDPGVVWITQWRPESTDEITDPSTTHFLGAMGHKA